MSLPKSPNKCILQKQKPACPFFFLIIIFESNTMSVKRPIHNSETDTGVVANLVKIGCSSN